MSSTPTLSFPSGLTISRAKQRAKAAVKIGGFSSLAHAQNAISYDQIGLPWSKAMARLKAQPKSNIQQFMTSRDILSVMKDLPSLTHYGFGAHKDWPFSIDHYMKKVEQEKESLTTAVDECNKACMYIQHLNKRKTINGASSTYGLKHGVENYIRCLQNIDDEYVANGAFICAAHYMGFNVEQGINGSPNGFINYSSGSPIMQWRRLSENHSLNNKAINKLALLEHELGLPLSTPPTQKVQTTFI
jgi:hypothetical protein